MRVLYRDSPTAYLVLLRKGQHRGRFSGDFAPCTTGVLVSTVHRACRIKFVTFTYIYIYVYVDVSMS